MLFAGSTLCHSIGKPSQLHNHQNVSPYSTILNLMEFNADCTEYNRSQEVDKPLKWQPFSSSCNSTPAHTYSLLQLVHTCMAHQCGVWVSHTYCTSQGKLYIKYELVWSCTMRSILTASSSWYVRLTTTCSGATPQQLILSLVLRPPSPAFAACSTVLQLYCKHCGQQKLGVEAWERN